MVRLLSNLASWMGILILALPVSSGRAGNRYLHSAAEFKWHMEAHIERLPILAERLRSSFPSDFTGVDPELLRRFLLECHDQSKVNLTPQFLRKFELTGKQPIYRRLYETLYGKSVRNLGRAAQRRGKRLVNELNVIDHQVAFEWLGKHGLLDPEGRPNEIARKLLVLEKVADGVDRTLFTISRFEEWGRPMQPAHQFYRNPVFKQYAFKLEADYWQLIDPMSFEKHKAARLAEISARQAACILGKLRPGFGTKSVGQ